MAFKCIDLPAIWVPLAFSILLFSSSIDLLLRRAVFATSQSTTMPKEGARLVIAIDIGAVQSAIAVSYDEPGEFAFICGLQDELIVTPTRRRDIYDVRGRMVWPKQLAMEPEGTLCRTV